MKCIKWSQVAQHHTAEGFADGSVCAPHPSEGKQVSSSLPALCHHHTPSPFRAGTDFHCVLLSPVSLVNLIVASSKMQPLDVYSHLGRAIKMMNELGACPCKRALRVDIDTQKIISLFCPFPVFNPVP